MAAIDKLAAIYRRTGIHGAPPGTLLHGINGLVRAAVHPRARRRANADTGRRGPFGATQYYDIGRLRRTRPVDGLALVFFIGAGDYLMATGFIRALHLAHPDLPIYAYASRNADNCNSPLVLHFLRANPLIKKVFAYDGRPRSIWTEYDFSDALTDIPPDFAILPVIYDTEPTVFHRHTSILETFGLTVELPVPLPVIDRLPMTAAAQDILAAILARAGNGGPKGIVVTHFGARSSGYEYPHAGKLVSRLLAQGRIVVSLSPAEVRHDNLIEIDIARITPTDTVEILRAVKATVPNLRIVSVNSIMWPVSAALAIPNLGLHTYWDGAVHQYLYPNIYVMTQHYYRTISPCRLVLAPYGTYTERALPTGPTLFTDYRPEFVADTFRLLFDAQDA